MVVAVSWELSVGRAYLAWRVANERRRVQVLQRRGGPLRWRRDALVVAAAQWDMRPVARVADWTARLVLQCDQATRAGAALIVFPEYVGLSLMGLLSEHRALRNASARQLTPAEVGDRLRAWAPTVVPLYRTVFSRLAAAYGITVVAGSTLVEHEGRMENLAHVFGPDGRLLATQPKLHLLATEASWGVVPGTRLAPISGPIPVQPVVCYDASFFETYRMARTHGAELVAVPIADPDPDYGEAKARRGAWARTQESGLVSVVGAGTGELYGILFTGKAAVYAPMAETPAGDGVLAESPHADGEGVVVATVNLDRLQEYRQHLPAPRADRVAAWLAPRYEALLHWVGAGMAVEPEALRPAVAAGPARREAQDPYASHER